jgi:hypothetical protein
LADFRRNPEDIARIHKEIRANGFLKKKMLQIIKRSTITIKNQSKSGFILFYSAALKQMNSRALNRAQRYKENFVSLQ